MNISLELAAKIVHTTDCCCIDCKRKRDLGPIPVPDVQSEKQFMAEVRDLLKMAGWRSYHTHDSRKSDAGFPDLVAVRGPRVVWIELKAEGGKATAAQLNWLEDLKAADQEVYLWRPSDWPEIVRTIR
jgi:hypothetical protein